MVQTSDWAAQLLGACGKQDDAGNIQTLSDSVEEVIADLAPVTVMVVLDLHHDTRDGLWVDEDVFHDWGFFWSGEWSTMRIPWM
jgi:hypothetical protein